MQVESHDPAGHAVDTGDEACEDEAVDTLAVRDLPGLCPWLLSAADDHPFLHPPTDCARFVFAQLVAGVVQAEALFSESRAGQWVEPWAQGRPEDAQVPDQLAAAVVLSAEPEAFVEVAVVEQAAIHFQGREWFYRPLLAWP